ncbi:unnamed protein product [Camellia sinensis]
MRRRSWLLSFAGRMPEGVAKEIDRIQSRFLWGGDELRRKIHMVKWEEITQSKSNGGLGIRKSTYWNLQAFMLFFKYVELPNFDVACDAFLTFKAFFEQYEKLLISSNYVTRRQSLKLLSEFLLESPNSHIMKCYIVEVRFMKVMMTLLKRVVGKALRLIFMEIFVKRKGLKLNPISVMYCVKPFCHVNGIIVIVQCSLLVHSVDFSKEAKDGYPRDMELSTCYPITQFSLYFCTQSIIVKDWVVVLLSAILFADTMLTMINLFGYGIAIAGNKVKKLCDLCNITVNKNVVFGDSSALSPGGVRIGTSAMTSRWLFEKDFEQIAEFLHCSVTITLKIQKENGRHAKKRLRSKNSVLPLDSSKNIQISAFHIFKVFVSNPNKPREIKVILAKNHERLLGLLHSLSPGKD